MISLSSLSYERVLVDFDFEYTNKIEVPVPLKFRTLEVNNSVFRGKEVGRLLLEKNGVNVEFLFDLLKDRGFFLQKGICCMYKIPKAHSVTSFYFGSEEKRVRDIIVVRKTITDFLGQAVWDLQIREDLSNTKLRTLVINLFSQKPYVSQIGEVFDVKPDFILQSQNGELVFESTSIKQSSAA